MKTAIVFTLINLALLLITVAQAQSPATLRGNALELGAGEDGSGLLLIDEASQPAAMRWQPCSAPSGTATG